MRTRQTPCCVGAIVPVVRCLITSAAAVVVALSVGRAWCDPSAIGKSAPEPNRNDTLRAYRRIFVPADRIDTWPREGRKYIPVEEKDFKDWLTAANSGTKQVPSSVMIEEASYQGSLSGADQIAGHGEWKITVRGEGPAFLPLLGESLAIRNARWKDRAEEPVRLGSWGTVAGAPNELGLVASRSGWLEFDWSIRRLPKDDSYDFPWDVPAALNTRLAIELPEGQTPDVDGGAILESTAVVLDGVSENNGSAPRRRWVLAHGPELGHRVLRISSGTEPRIGRTEGLELQGKVSYQTEQRGLEIQAEWKLEGSFSEQRELAVSLPAGIQLLSVAVEGQELSWRIVRNASPKADQALISLPRDSESRLLNLKATLWQPITFGEPWQLPNVWPDNVLWRSAELVLSVAPELELRRIEPVDCQQTGVLHLGADSTEPEVFSFAAYSPTSALKVVLNHREAEVRVRAGTSLALTDPDVIGRLVTHWSVSRGQAHRLSGGLGRGWTIEAVETIPADAMAEWFIERHDDRRNLEIRLTDAVTPTREISVIVTGRLQRLNVTDTMSADMLRMVDWEAVRETRRLLMFQSSERFVVESGGGAIAVPRESLREGDLELLDEAAEKAAIFDLANTGKEAHVRLVARRGQYSGEIAYEAECSGEGLRHSWQIVAQPRSNAIDRLLVYATAPLGSTARWSEKSTDLPITAELLSADDPLRRNVPREGEAWLLRLPQPSSKPVAISLAIGGSLSSQSTVPLLALPEAVEQSGLVTVRTPPELMPLVRATRCQSLPIPLERGEADGQLQLPVRLTYQYMPQDCFDPSRAPRLEIGAAVKPGMPLLTIRHANVESFVNAEGISRHRVTYELQNVGASEFKATFQDGVTVTAAYVDGLPVSPSAGNSPTISVPLMSGVQSPKVIIFCETSTQRFSVYSTIESPIGHELYPTLASDWLTWLPQDWAATADEGSSGLFDWRQRIFGFLAPDGHSRSLELPRLANWAGIVGRADNVGDDAAAVRGVADRSKTDTPFADAILSIPVPSTPAVNWIPTWTIAPQSANHSAAILGTELLGWHSVVRRFIGSGPHGVVAVSRPATIKSWAVACLMISFFVGLSSQLGWRLRIIGIIAACCFALTLPKEVAPLATGVIWGTVFSQLWTWCMRTSVTERSAVTHVPVAVPVISVLILLMSCGNQALAFDEGARTPSQDEGKATPTHIESVLIPVDTQKKPVGTKVFLSEQFLRDLVLESQGSTPRNHPWLLTAAAYTGELTESRRTSDFAAGVWTLAFNLETSLRQTLVRLPLVREEAIWQSTAMLDGVPQPIIWAQDGHSCVLTIPEPGRYVLSIFCTPKIEKAGSRGQLHLSIPKLPVSKLALQLPPELSGVQFPNAVLAQPTKDRLGLVDGELFHSDRINLSWGLTNSKEATAQRLNVSELNWLYVGEEGIELVAKFVVEGSTRRPDVLTIRYDDRWTLQADGSQVAKDSRAVKSDHLESLQLRLPSAEDDRQEVLVRWRLSDRREIGNIRIAPIVISPTPTTQRWFAVSADSTFDCTLLDKSITTTTAKEFQNKWGNVLETSAPQIALANVPDDKLLTISIRPREQVSSVRELLHIAAGIPSTRVCYQADITPGSANTYQFPLDVSPTLNIDGVTLSTGGQQVPVRWTRDGSTRVTVLFGAPVKSDYRLVVNGRLPSAEGQPIAVPRISALQGGAVTRTVQLYRDDNVNLSLQGFSEPNGAKTGSSTAPPIEWQVRPVGVFDLNDTAFQAGRMVLRASRPVVQGDSLTRLSFEDGKWFTELRSRLVVEQDNLDVLQISVPGSCAGPFEVEASVPVTTDSKSQKDGRQALTVRFGTSVAQGKEVALRLRALLTPPAGNAPAVPVIQVAPFRGRELIGVPKTLNGQLLGWTNVGARPIEISDDWRRILPDNAAFAFFEAENSQHKVELQSQTVRQSTPSVRLAETYAILDQESGQLLVSRFAVLPDGITQCILSLPTEQELLSATLDCRPALAVPTSATEWSVTLESDNLPQMLTVVSRVARATSPYRTALERPTLRTDAGPLPADISLWSLAQSGSSEAVQAETATSVSAGDFAALRFDRLVSLVERVTATVESIPRANAAQWQNEWDAIIRESQTAALRAKNTFASVPTIAQHSYSAEEQIQVAAKRFDAWRRTLDANMNTSPTRSSHSIPWDELTSDFNVSSEKGRQHAIITNYVFDGDTSRIPLVKQGIMANLIVLRFIAVATAVGAGTLLIWLLSNTFAIAFICRWPHSIGVLGGIFYWTFLWPSSLGLIIVVVSLWLGLRTTWPGRAIRPEASTVLRSTRTLPTQ